MSIGEKSPFHSLTFLDRFFPCARPAAIGENAPLKQEFYCQTAPSVGAHASGGGQTGQFPDLAPGLAFPVASGVGSRFVS